MLLYSHVKTYAYQVDANMKLQLFQKNHYKVVENMFQHIACSCLSDPPGVSFYTMICHDKDGLPIYHCHSGMNNVEGGVHQELEWNFSSCNAGAPFLQVWFS